MRALLALLAALLSAPAMAQEVPPERIGGVWRGTVGDLPVHACFDWREWQSELFGLYFYDRHLRPIRLRPGEDRLDEEVGWGNPNGASWQLERLSGERLFGTWRQDARTLPIVLQRIDWETREYSDSACDSASFVAPRLTGGSVSEERTDLAGQGYTELYYIAPAHWRESPEDPAILVRTFRLDESEPGDGAINRELARMLDVEDPDSDAVGCVTGNLIAFGVDGNFDIWAEPEVLTERWLGLHEASFTFCGGPHPNYSQRRRVFDRRSGEEVDPDDWINSRGMIREMDRLDDTTFEIERLTEEMRALLVGHWPIEGEYEDVDCADVARDEEFWALGLADDGMAFIPFMPYVINVCSETVTVPWSELEPFLSDAGREVAASLTE